MTPIKLYSTGYFPLSHRFTETVLYLNSYSMAWMLWFYSVSQPDNSVSDALAVQFTPHSLRTAVIPKLRPASRTGRKFFCQSHLSYLMLYSLACTLSCVMNT